jgi:hypothetical protein
MDLKPSVLVFFGVMILTNTLVYGRNLSGEKTSIGHGEGISKISCVSTAEKSCADALSGGEHDRSHFVGGFDDEIGVGR